MIENAARDGLAELHPAPQIRGPYELAVEFDVTSPVAAVCSIPGVVRTASRRVSYTSETMIDVMRCFKTITVVTAASREASYG